MTLVQEVLSDAVVDDFIKRNELAAERIRRAAALLIQEQGAECTAADVVPAMRKLLPSLAEQIINVFFSCKRKDERTAQTIVELLRESSAGRLRISYLGDFGKDIVDKPAREDQRQRPACKLVHPPSPRSVRRAGLVPL